MAAWALWSSCRQTVNLELRIAAADGFREQPWRVAFGSRAARSGVGVVWVAWWCLETAEAADFFLGGVGRNGSTWFPACCCTSAL